MGVTRLVSKRVGVHCTGIVKLSESVSDASELEPLFIIDSPLR